MDSEDNAASVEQFFSGHDIMLSDVRVRYGKSFGHVTLASADDQDKALALSGEELAGNPLKIDVASKPKQQNQFGPRPGGGGGE